MNHGPLLKTGGKVFLQQRLGCRRRNNGYQRGKCAHVLIFEKNLMVSLFIFLLELINSKEQSLELKATVDSLQ